MYKRMTVSMKTKVNFAQAHTLAAENLTQYIYVVYYLLLSKFI